MKGKIVYQNSIEATQGFNSRYCVGSGTYVSVYWANLSAHEVVAVESF